MNFDEQPQSNFWVAEPDNSYSAKPNTVLEKSFSFAVRIVKLYRWLSKQHHEIAPLAKQILRSGTSIGANAEEADAAFTKREFAAKLGISLKESRETKYWLRLFYATEYLDESMFLSMRSDNDELMRLLTAILKTTRENLKNE